MRKYLLPVIFFFVYSGLVSAQDNILLNAADKEMQRTMKELSAQALPPYFVSYSITEVQSAVITASFGSIEKCDMDKSRILDIDLRVGNYKFDNTHIIRGNPFSFGSRMGYVQLPIEDNESAVRSAIWYATDKTFKDAAERYEKALTNQKVKVAEEDTSSDMSHEKPEIYYKDFKSLKPGSLASSGNEVYIDTVKWKEMVKRLSSKFKKFDKLISGDISLSVKVLNKVFINSEGSKLSYPETDARLFVSAKTKADDGMSLPLYESYFAFTPDGLPSEEKIGADIDKMIILLEQLREAPLAETFTGPAILSGEASGVFFHEIFGHRVEGHREKDPNSSQTFKQSIGKKILPEFIDVVFDPTLNKLDGREISGYYKFDDEGVLAQRVEAVKNGNFQNFLMSRSPIEGFSHSNGHGRKQAGYTACSRQSNLIVNSHKSVSSDSLKIILKQEVKKQNKEYGLYFETVSGGFTFTNRYIPNAFNVTPLVVYKIYADGRKDELVRGVDLIGTPLTTFSNIIAAGTDIGIFNGVCGAESGGVPVSACSPSILVSQIEVQKKQKSQAKPPILDAPKNEAD